jgi:hypothetical protein
MGNDHGDPKSDYYRLYKEPSFKHILPNNGSWDGRQWCKLTLGWDGPLNYENHREKTMKDLEKSKAAWPHAPHPYYDATCIGLNSEK